ncbi:MAG: hypothetical protein IPK18_00295 [Sphingobacteriales bacterium]|nr:MAG: hypothetical protein IPK18_00295 [Sphingobacteriales bacterium]
MPFPVYKKCMIGSSQPTQTPVIIVESKFINQASVFLIVFPDVVWYGYAFL